MRAKLWFDGKYACDAKEDAAEEMMKYFIVKQNMRQTIHNNLSNYAELTSAPG